MSYESSVERGPIQGPIAGLFDRAERTYLLVLRAAILIVATLMLIYCAWLAVSSIYKVSQSPDSVVEETAQVSADELLDAEAPERAAVEADNSKASSIGDYQSFYADFVRRYYALFRSKFEPYRQAEDKQLTKDEFDGSFIDTAGRLDAISKGDLDFSKDRDDLETLLTTMAAAAENPKTTQRLQRYKAARKVPVTTKVQRTRTSIQRGWDPNATWCSDWYEEPMGCAAARPVSTNYTETVTTMQFPKGTQSHTQIFRAFQDRYLSLLKERRESNAATAERKKQEIVASIAEGKLSITTALRVLGAFLALMFFFLLIAIERHQRRISAAIGGTRQEQLAVDEATI